MEQGLAGNNASILCSAGELCEYSQKMEFKTLAVVCDV